MHNEENHSLIQWIIAAHRIMQPNKSSAPVKTRLWTSMEENQNYIIELGMKEAIHGDAFESPDLVSFSAWMEDLILQ